MTGAALDIPPPVDETTGPTRTPQVKLLRGYLHKTSNSLCGIKGFASLIARDDDQAAATSRWARKIIAEVERMEAIYRSVGDLTGASSPDARPADLATIVNDAIAVAQARHPGLSVCVDDLPAARPLLPAADLQQILGALLDNCAEGADGLPRPVTARMTWRPATAGLLHLLMTDDGPGIPSAILSKATDPFVTTKDGHVGIGLARVDTLMDLHGLDWRLTTRPGGGTCVQLTVARSGDDHPATPDTEER